MLPAVLGSLAPLDPMYCGNNIFISAVLNKEPMKYDKPKV